jgi:hypothetical protein
MTKQKKSRKEEMEETEHKNRSRQKIENHNEAIKK